MRSVISRCSICGQFFDSKKGLKDHIDKNHRLDPGKFDYVYIKYSVDLFYDAYYMDPQYDQPGLVDLMSDIEDQIGQVDAALQFLDAEKAP